MAAAIRVEGIGKLYRLGSAEPAHDRISELLVDTLSRFRRRGTAKGAAAPDRSADLWALRDVSFEVPEGSAFGIIGRNGAGKSTLLKILARVTYPTTGTAFTRGRVGTLLEVGTGFHPELSGRENVFLNGAILGMARAEIQAKLDEIVEFAELASFIDTPVKRYSSGMYMRLAFAVAAHLEPDILIVDEVLAVGDVAFQRKCLARMTSASHAGRTILFVSHNLSAIQSLCDRVLVLDKGRVSFFGDAQTAVHTYLGTGSDELEASWPPGSRASQTQVRLDACRLSTTAAATVGVLTRDSPLTIAFDVFVIVDRLLFNVSVHVNHVSGVCAFNTYSMPQRMTPGAHRFAFRIPARFLNEGRYSLDVLLVRDAGTIVDRVENALSFTIHDSERPEGWYGQFPGVVRPDLVWDIDGESAPLDGACE